MLTPANVHLEKTQNYFLTHRNTVSLFGADLTVDSIPFQAQDQGVSACATMTLWTALESLQHFGVPELSPSEITEKATQLPSLFRRYPQGGLTLDQMIGCIRFPGLDVEAIFAKDTDVVVAAIKAYTYAQIPLIADLELTMSNDEKVYHAAVISGYETDIEGTVTKLYVHDDQLGPYTIVEPLKEFYNWKNDWLKLGFKKVALQLLLVPVYHKIRLPFTDIYTEFSNVRAKKEADQSGIKVDLFLTTVQNYKRELVAQKIQDKVEKLKMSMPKFMDRKIYRKREK